MALQHAAPGALLLLRRAHGVQQAWQLTLLAATRLRAAQVPSVQATRDVWREWWREPFARLESCRMDKRSLSARRLRSAK